MMNNIIKYRIGIWSLLAFALVTLVAWVVQNPNILQTHVIHANSAEASYPLTLNHPTTKNLANTNCRYGAIPLSRSQAEYLDDLNIGMYNNFNSFPFETAPPNIEHMNLIGVHGNYDKDELDPNTGIGTHYPGYYLRNNMSLQELSEQILASPGALWIIGNEMERAPDKVNQAPDQGNIYPDEFAKAYHELYYLVKQTDPTAQVGFGALVQVTPARLHYLDEVLAFYQQFFGHTLPADFWTIHVYPNPEAWGRNGEATDIASIPLSRDPATAAALAQRTPTGPLADRHQYCDDPTNGIYCFADQDSGSIFKQQITEQRRWMKRNGYRNMPLYITEYSILMNHNLVDEFGNDFPTSRVSTFMDNTFEIVDTYKNPNLGYRLDNNRMIQHSAWYAVFTTGGGYVSNLIEDPARTLNDFSTPWRYSWFPSRLSTLGTRYADHVAAQPLTNNLMLSKVGLVISQERREVTLTVHFRNNGNSAIVNPFNVSFYGNRERTKEIGVLRFFPDELHGLQGCGRPGHELSASVTWNPWRAQKDASFDDTVFDYWVTLDSDNEIAETEELPTDPSENSDNVISSQVILASDTMYIPMFKHDVEREDSP